VRPRAPAAGGTGSGSGRVFGSLTSTLMNAGGIDSIASNTGAKGAGAQLDFVLADDLPAVDPIVAVAWVSDSSLVFMTRPSTGGPRTAGSTAGAASSPTEGAPSLVLLETDTLEVSGYFNRACSLLA